VDEGDASRRDSPQFEAHCLVVFVGHASSHMKRPSNFTHCQAKSYVNALETSIRVRISGRRPQRVRALYWAHTYTDMWACTIRETNSSRNRRRQRELAWGGCKRNEMRNTCQVDATLWSTDEAPTTRRALSCHLVALHKLFQEKGNK